MKSIQCPQPAYLYVMKAASGSPGQARRLVAFHRDSVTACRDKLTGSAPARLPSDRRGPPAPHASPLAPNATPASAGQLKWVDGGDP